MALKPNYGLQRADRNRATQAQSEEKKENRERKNLRNAKPNVS